MFHWDKLAADIDVTSNPLLSKEFSINDGERTFNFRAINEKDVLEAISKIKLKKSFGKDNTSGYFLKISFPLISRILALIFNISIETSTFPDTLKIALVTPVFKEGDKSENQIIDLYQYYLFYLGFSRNLSMTSCTNIKRGMGS